MFLQSREYDGELRLVGILDEFRKNFGLIGRIIRKDFCDERSF